MSRSETKIRLRPVVKKRAAEYAALQNRSLSNLIESALITELKRRKQITDQDLLKD